MSKKRPDWMVYRGYVIHRSEQGWQVVRDDKPVFTAASQEEAMEWIDKKREQDYSRKNKR